MIELCDANGTCCGYLDTPPSPTVRIEKIDFNTTPVQMTVRLAPGKFACFKVYQVRLPLHILAAVIQSEAFKPRGEVQHVANPNDPELKFKSDTKH